MGKRGGTCTDSRGSLQCEMNLDSCIDHHKLSASREFIRGLVRPCIRLVPRRVEQAHLTPISSRFGGLPHVPRGTTWPVRNGEALSHVATLNLVELARFDSQRILPQEGLLQFWYDQDAFEPVNQAEVDERASRSDKASDEVPWTGVLIIHITDLSDLTLIEPPVDFEYVYRPCALDCVTGESLPCSIWLHRYGPTNSDSLFDHKYDEFRTDFHGNGYHQMFGYADYVQSSALESACEMIRLGQRKWTQPKGTVLENEREWIPLLQCDSDTRETGFCWADAGMAYFWIRKRDLLSHRFDRVVAMVESL